MDIVLVSALALLGTICAAIAGLVRAEVRYHRRALHRPCHRQPHTPAYARSRSHSRRAGWCGGRPRTGSQRAGAHRPPACCENPWAPFVLQPTTGRDDLKGQYRALARSHHPDHGGDPHTMARINLLYHELLERVVSDQKS